MQRARNWGAAAPAIGRRIVDFEFALATEAADNVDFPAHLGHRHLGTGGGHWGADDATADTLGEGRGSKQGTAGQQHAAEKHDEFASPHHSIPRRPPFAERDLWNIDSGSASLRLDVEGPDEFAPLLGL